MMGTAGMTHSHFVGITALSATLIAGILYQTMVGNSLSNDPVISLFGTVVATFLVAGLCWWGFISRPKRPTPLRGALTGLLISLLAFPVAFAITLCISLIEGDVAADVGVNEYFLYIFGLGLLAIAIVGVFTIPIGLLGGAALGYLQRRVVRDDR
jgi:hypothetical protein